jgi:hypothetical protein
VKLFRHRGHASRIQTASSQSRYLSTYSSIIMADLDLRSLLGSNPLSTELENYIAFVVANASLDQPISPEIKSYSDAVYFNYYQLGLSLQFAPKDGYKPASGLKQNQLKNDKLSLDSIYLYNTIPREKGASSFSTHPVPPLVLEAESECQGQGWKFIISSFYAGSTIRTRQEKTS